MAALPQVRGSVARPCLAFLELPGSRFATKEHITFVVLDSAYWVIERCSSRKHHILYQRIKGSFIHTKLFARSEK
ncbi:uncharacterized protein G2W53_007247 [Senna tora]|uniref:Uncharacterized protein n=1 Tax=Senna tora TaxID=362788 RepID=A0A834X5U2_9FABA|nr:uncharacterized protein G2W53_007240 [Senna tora]KAF7838765.1 uncharacterized protein G2W53_007247 [Senna tora]